MLNERCHLIRTLYQRYVQETKNTQKIEVRFFDCYAPFLGIYFTSQTLIPIVEVLP
jgi:hypothetical protein